MRTEDHAFLREMGWGPFQDSWYQFDLQSLSPARVVGEEKGIYRVQFGSEVTELAEVRGKLRHEAQGRKDYPAVGDWVLCQRDPGMGHARIERIIERKTCLARKQAGTRSEQQILAANVDVAFIVTSANGDFNPKRLMRYLTLVWDSGAKPVVLISKAELAEDAQTMVAEVQTLSPGLDVHAISAMTGVGEEALSSYLYPGVTVVLLGSSGVGKSTLVNWLSGRELMVTREIRESDDRGRHATTGRHLIRLPSGALLIDTPGMRELALGDHEEGLGTLFEDVENLMTSCRFTDCAHETEPGCAIRAALESGELADDRFVEYQKLKREIAFQQRKESKSEASREKAKWKKIHNQARQHMAHKKKWGE